MNNLGRAMTRLSHFMLADYVKCYRCEAVIKSRSGKAEKCLCDDADAWCIRGDFELAEGGIFFKLKELI